MEQKKNLELIKKDIYTQVLMRVDAFQKSGELRLPKDYAPENALKAAYLILSDHRNNLLEKCTKESVANSLLKMVVWGLSPLKKQCDFIPFGDKLECSASYTGNIILAKRFGNLKWIKANAIFKDDVFQFEVDPATGHKKIIKHEQTLESISCKELKGAYAIYELNDGTRDVEIMNIVQIKDAWNQGAAKGNSPAHRNFPDQMAIKTVINRACKMLVRSSDDSALFVGDENDDLNSSLQEEIGEKANMETISFDEVASESSDWEEAEEKPSKSEKVLDDDVKPKREEKKPAKAKLTQEEINYQKTPGF